MHETDEDPTADIENKTLFEGIYYASSGPASGGAGGIRCELARGVCLCDMFNTFGVCRAVTGMSDYPTVVDPPLTHYQPPRYRIRIWMNIRKLTSHLEATALDERMLTGEKHM